MKLDECLPALPRGDVYSMKRDDQAKMEYWTERQVIADRLACARAGALAALDEAANICVSQRLERSRGDAMADACAMLIRRLRDTIAKGESE